MHAHASSVAAYFATAFLVMITGCLTVMEPSVVPARGESSDVATAVRRTLAAEGHEIDSADVDAGIVYTAWKVWNSTDQGSLVYRYVVIHEDDTVRVSAQLQDCPGHSTVFDHCAPYRFKKIPQSIQNGLTSLGDQLQVAVAGSSV